jgi:predicted phage terminase large subunit-like protein
MIHEAECPPAYVYREWTVLQAWDLAIGLKQQHNYSVGITGALDPDNRLWILHMVRGRWDIYGLANQVLDQYERFRPSKIGVERGPLELALMPAVKRELAERNKNLKTRQVKLTPYFLQGKHSLVPINDKLMRARPLESMMQQGAVFWSKGAPWLDNMRHEMLRFPSGVLEDCVDAAAWLARMSTMVSPPRKTEPKDPWVGRKGSWRERVKRIASGQRGDGDFMGA